MSKTVNFEEAQKPVILASNYTITHTTDDGKTIVFELDGEEMLETHCPVCGRKHAISLGEALSGGEFDLYSTHVYCFECSAKRAAERESTDQSK